MAGVEEVPKRDDTHRPLACTDPRNTSISLHVPHGNGARVQERGCTYKPSLALVQRQRPHDGAAKVHHNAPITRCSNQGVQGTNGFGYEVARQDTVCHGAVRNNERCVAVVSGALLAIGEAELTVVQDETPQLSNMKTQLPSSVIPRATGGLLQVSLLLDMSELGLEQGFGWDRKGAASDHAGTRV